MERVVPVGAGRRRGGEGRPQAVNVTVVVRYRYIRSLHRLLPPRLPTNDPQRPSPNINAAWKALCPSTRQSIHATRQMA